MGWFRSVGIQIWVFFHYNYFPSFALTGRDLRALGIIDGHVSRNITRLFMAQKLDPLNVDRSACRNVGLSSAEVS